jgi:hypothetical protein
MLARPRVHFGGARSSMYCHRRAGGRRGDSEPGEAGGVEEKANGNPRSRQSRRALTCAQLESPDRKPLARPTLNDPGSAKVRAI